MTHHVFLLLLLCLLLFSLARLSFLGWLHHAPAQLAAAKRSRLPRLLKPRTPDDCPVCRHTSPASSGVGPGSPSVRPWREVKSRRGAPKRLNTEGFSCPNPKCSYFANTDAQVHALVGDGKHGRTEPIQTFRCQACRTTFTCPSQHALVSAENPFPSGRHGALCAGRRARPFRSCAGRRAFDTPRLPPG